MPQPSPDRYRFCRDPSREVLSDGCPQTFSFHPDVETIMAGWRVHREILDQLRRRSPGPVDPRILFGVGALSITTVFVMSSQDYDVAEDSHQPEPALLHEFETEELQEQTAPEGTTVLASPRQSHATALVRQPRTTPDGPLLPPPMPGSTTEPTDIVRVGFESDAPDQPRTSNTVWLTGEIETMDE